MKQAYTPALTVAEETIIAKVRELPLPGKSLVKKGDKVEASDEVLSAELPGDVEIIRIADRLGLDAEDVLRQISVSVGDDVSKNQPICEVKMLFGLLRSEVKSPVVGKVEFLTEHNAHLGIRLPSKPLTIDAYVDGTVVDVDEGKSVTINTSGALIQGIFGVGGENRGIIVALDVASDKVVEKEDLEKLGNRLSNSVLIGGGQFSIGAIRYATEQGAKGIVTGSIDSETLHEYVGREIGVSITGDEDVKATLIITEGFGSLPISSRISSLAVKLDGKWASLNGTTQVRAGAMRPEIIISNEGDATREVSPPHISLDVGTRVRVVRVPYFGQFGTVTELPHSPRLIPSGAEVRVLKTKLDSGEEVYVPRANVELVE